MLLFGLFTVLYYMGFIMIFYKLFLGFTTTTTLYNMYTYSTTTNYSTIDIAVLTDSAGDDVCYPSDTSGCTKRCQYYMNNTMNFNKKGEWILLRIVCYLYGFY